MHERLERQARNEALIREVNERIDDIDKKAPGSDQDDLFDFLCECGRQRVCDATVEVTLAEYEAVRSQDDRFVVRPGHETAMLEHVVGGNDRYIIVDKIPDAEPVVENDPRGAPSH